MALGLIFSNSNQFPSPEGMQIAVPNKEIICSFGHPQPHNPQSIADPDNLSA